MPRRDTPLHRRASGVVVTDPKGDLTVARLGSNLTVIDGEINASASGTGDVVGPASAVDDRIATYDGVTGKLIQDGGATIASVLSSAAAAAAALDAALLPIDLTSEVTGDLPYANLAPATGASKILVRGSAGGAGDWEEGTLGSGLTLTGTVLSASAVGSGDVVGPASAVDDRLATYDGVTGKLIQDGGATIADVLASAAAAAAALYAPLVHNSWVPLALGTEPLTFVSDGAGRPVFVSYTP